MTPPHPRLCTSLLIRYPHPLLTSQSVPFFQQKVLISSFLKPEVPEKIQGSRESFLSFAPINREVKSLHICGRIPLKFERVQDLGYDFGPKVYWRTFSPPIDSACRGIKAGIRLRSVVVAQLVTILLEEFHVPFRVAANCSDVFGPFLLGLQYSDGVPGLVSGSDDPTA